ncbi:hypothetical protein ZWY2020_029867 [Hordeum vulgare]|nr:hypothetical protein ZWY2020_029867 [Hordeum vulgare]
MQVTELLGAAVAAPDEDLRERDPAGAQEERRELLEVAGDEGKVALVDGGAKPPRDGARGVAVLVGAPDDVEGGLLEQDAVVGLDGGW